MCRYFHISKALCNGQVIPTLGGLSRIVVTLVRTIVVTALVAVLLFSVTAASAEQIYKGTYVHSFEVSDFQECESGETWWLMGPAYPQIRERVIDIIRLEDGYAYFPNQPIYLEIKGTRSEKGSWGHLGGYVREIQAISITKIERRAPSNCEVSPRIQANDSIRVHKP